MSTHMQDIMPSHDAQVDLYWQAWLPDTDPQAVIILAHGLGEHSGRYAHVAAVLNTAGYAVYALDHRGFGQSGGKRGHIDRFDLILDDLGLLIVRAAGEHPGKKLFLYGHSLGGIIVLNHALRRPAGLAGVIATSSGLIPTISPMLMFMARTLGNLVPNMTLSSNLDTAGLSRDPAVEAAYLSDPLVHDRTTARFGDEGLKAAVWALEQAAEMTLPFLVMHGSADKLCAPEGSREFFEKAQIEDKAHIEYAGYYHEIHNDIDNECFFEDMITWLKAHS